MAETAVGKGRLVNREAIDAFWRDRAATGTTRWTDDRFLEHDRSIVLPLLSPTSAILDLGSGFGELSRSLCPAEGRLVAVDSEPAFAEGFTGDDRFSFVTSDVVTFSTDSTFDVVLLFGVVTYLTPEQESTIYAVIRTLLSPGGVAVIKNQCADDSSFVVDTTSDALGARYVGRYPTVDEQLKSLSATLDSVVVHNYPDDLKVHDNSSHVAFICRPSAERHAGS